MPRTYSFDHYKAINPQAARGLRKKEREQVAQSTRASAPPVEKFHYGKAHAETEDILAAKAMTAQLEELAGLEPEGEPQKQRLERKQVKASRTAREDVAPRMPAPQRPTAPIGALPTGAEEPPGGLLSDIMDQAGRHVRMVGSAARELGRASLRLVSFPLHAARMAARRLRVIRT